MIEHINERLMRWADWAAGGRRAIGLGYSPCTLGRWDVSCTFRVVDPAVDEESSDTDRAICLLPAQLLDIVIRVYLRPGTMRQKARDVGLTPKAFYERLHHAHQRIADVLETKPRHWPVQSTFGQGA